MVLLLYLWENVKKWSSFDSEEEMREPYHYYGGGGEQGKPYTTDQGYQQMGGLRRLDTSAIRTHFYPEGGWGWIVCACAFLAHVTTSGAQLSAGALHIVLANKFQDSSAHHWLGPLSWSVSSVFSPLVVNLCRRKNVRILSLIGGILFPLSLLFTSFATELHQIFFSFGLIGGIGSCMVRESSGVVLGEYFRKRRQFVEQVVMAGTGVGVTLFSLLYLSFTRHLEWGVGFRVGAAFCTICILLPAFYRTASQYQPTSSSSSRATGHNNLLKSGRVESPKSPSSILVPIGGDICRSLNLFCVPALKPVLWSAAFSSFGLYAPVFLMSDFGRSEGLSGGSLLLLQTHLGLGLSLGVILGAILTLKKFRCCQLSARMLCCSTACLTGLSMIAISSVKGYYGYSLSAWIYGVALGSHLYTLKVLTMELTRTKHWSRIWSCIQSLMSPGILLGSGVTSYVGKPGFYACATFVLIGAGLIGFQMIDLTKCGSPQLSSSVDNDSPIPPAPPPISLNKYGHPTPILGGSGLGIGPPGFYPLRRSISLQQPTIYPCCREADFSGLGFGLGYSPYPPGYSPYCRECVLSSPIPPGYLGSMVGGGGGLYSGAGMQPGAMIRSYSLPQTNPNLSSHLKSTGTQTNPNSPVHSPTNTSLCTRNGQMYPGSYDRLPTLPGSFLPQDRVIRDDGPTNSKSRGGFQITNANATTSNGNGVNTITSSSYKNTVMFASNPQLFPASATQSSATSTTDRSATPNSHSNYSHSHNNHNHNHLNHHRHNHHNHSPRSSSPRHYYPQREERRANFIKSHQRSFDSQQFSLEDSSNHHHPPQPVQIQTQQTQNHHQQQNQNQRYYPAVVTVETHKKPGEISTKTSEKPPEQNIQQQQASSSSQSQRQQPAFTRHYFDSSKIQKGPNKSILGHSSSSSTGPTRGQGQAPGQNQNQPIVYQQSAQLPRLHQQITQQQLQQQSASNQSQIQQSLPLSAINAKLQQYQRQQQQQQLQEFNWRNIQRQNNPFEEDPDPPYYPASNANAGTSHAQQTNAYNMNIGVGGRNTNTSTKVSSSEFDVEQPKFNSLRRPEPKSTHNSSMSSQLNHSITGPGGQGQNGHSLGQSYSQTPVHYHHHHQSSHAQGQRHQHQHSSQSHYQNQSQINQQAAESRRRQGNQNNLNNPNNNENHARTTDCPYCDLRIAPPPLSLSVPALQQSDPHYMCHYGYGGAPPPYLRRRNTWHHHRDQLEAITTSV